MWKVTFKNTLRKLGGWILVSTLGHRSHWQSSRLATTVNQCATVVRFNAIFGSGIFKNPLFQLKYLHSSMCLT